MLDRREFMVALTLGCLGLFARRALANETWRLTLARPQTNEVAEDVIFWRGGRPDPQSLALLDWLLRDVRAGAVTSIDLRLYLGLSLLQSAFGGRLIVVTSGYRTYHTNHQLRQQGFDVARNSYHLVGRAVDLRVDNVPIARVAGLAERLGVGGVGRYSRFVHLDTGPRRQWAG